MVLPFEAILPGGPGGIPIEQDHIKFLTITGTGFFRFRHTRGVSVGRSAALSARTGNSLLRASPHRPALRVAMEAIDEAMEVQVSFALVHRSGRLF